MVNVLIADDNIDYAITLMNYINEQNNNIRICSIAKNGREVLEILNKDNDIDVVLLDYKMPICNGKQVLDNIENKNKYIDSCIIISGELESAVELRDNNLVYSIISKTKTMYEINEKIKDLIKYKETTKYEENIKNKIIKEVLYLGYDISHKGTQYLINTIHYIALNNNSIDNLEKYVYPIIAKKYGDNPKNVKGRINKETDNMYYNCEIEKLKRYFYLDIDIKPKVKYVINIIINKINKM